MRRQRTLWKTVLCLSCVCKFKYQILCLPTTGYPYSALTAENTDYLFCDCVEGRASMDEGAALLSAFSAIGILRTVLGLRSTINEQLRGLT